MKIEFSEQSAKFIGAGVALGIVAILFTFMPFAVIVSLNALSEQAKWGWHIPHNLLTYLSIFILVSVVSNTGKITQKGKKNAAS